MSSSEHIQKSRTTFTPHVPPVAESPPVDLIPTADNVWIRMSPVGRRETESGLTVIEKEAYHRGARRALVLASGKGYYRKRKHAGGETLGPWTEETSVFVPNETKAGDVVLVDALAGDNWDFNFNVPRHNKSPEFQALFDVPGEYRCIREDQILGVVEDV